MDDLQLFDTDGDFLVLEAQGGAKYRLLIDESVRASIRREVPIKLDTVSITPREIQEEIRNGATISELVDRTGAPFNFVEKFAAPVIAELDHVVSSALSIRLTIAGDRYSDSTQVEFGEVIGSRLVASGASSISWMAKKLDTNSWNIVANYQINGGDGSATWNFDPRRLNLSPESETAVTISSSESLTNNLIPKLRPVVSESLIPEPAMAETVLLTPVAQPATAAPAVSQPNKSVPAAFQTPTNLSTEEPLSATADLLEALRRKRTERESLNLEPEPDEDNIRVLEFQPVIAQSPDPSESPDAPVGDASQLDAEPKEGLKKGRASMPSWDEIVFGTKTED